MAIKNVKSQNRMGCAFLSGGRVRQGKLASHTIVADVRRQFKAWRRSNVPPADSFGCDLLVADDQDHILCTLEHKTQGSLSAMPSRRRCWSHTKKTALRLIHPV